MDKLTFLIIAVLVLVMSVGLYKLIRDGIAMAVKRLLQHEYPGKQFINQNREIYTALVELRALTDADRAYVIQFHNGHEFLLSNPVWKLTCTHEVVRSGVTYEASNIQNLLVSRVTEIIGPIIAGDFSGDGISINPACSNCHYQPKCRATRKFCSSVQVPKLSVGFSKFFLENQNIRTIVQCGMSSKHGAFGLVGVDYCGRSVEDAAHLAEISECVCRIAERVQHSLQYKQAPLERVATKI